MNRCKAGHEVPQDEDLVGEALGTHNGGGRGKENEESEFHEWGQADYQLGPSQKTESAST